MKIFIDRKIRCLFCNILISILVLGLISIVILNYQIKNAAPIIFLCSLCMAFIIMILCYRYFKDQHKIIENASKQIDEYISGNKSARIKCNDEGDLYVMFHKVNSLVSILNARAENELKSKEFLKNTISDISHQLKTPLAALNIYNGILQDESEKSSTIEKFTNLTEQELDRIDTLVQSLLKITKLDAGTVIMEKKIENVSGLLESVKKHFSFRAEQGKKTITLKGSSDITLLCDRVWIMEALDNIVKNALDHTKEGNDILIEWRKFASVVQIIIKDNGSGIHPEDLHHIFKRFYRSRFSMDTQGIGLGLPLAKMIVEAHDGTIEVDSELGVGTTFVINFLIPTEL